MGNEQSAPAPRRRPPNRLSKPKTNNHSSANLLDKRPSAPASRRNSVSTNASPTKNRDIAVLGDERGGVVVEAKKQETSKRRMSLFRSKSSKPSSPTLELNKDEEKSALDSSPLEEPSHRWSREPRLRGNSLTTQTSLRSRSIERPYSEIPSTGLSKPPIRSRMSLQTYTHHPRLSLVAELPAAQPKSNPTRRHSRYGEEEDSPKGFTQSSRTNSESALYTPIRRRSLLQHGVATRTSFAESDSRSSLPSQTPSDLTPPQRLTTQDLADDLRAYYYNPAKPTSSPLSGLGLLGPDVEFVDIGPRTETPTQLEHIGAYKLGSLRITNGAASPVPSVKSPEDDYISAGNARRSLERGGGRSNTLSVPAEVRKSPWIVHTESPLRQSDEVKQTVLSLETQLPLIESSSFSWFDFEGTDDQPKITESPSTALDLAKDYQQDLALSPFSFDNSPSPSPRLPSPRLESTSKNTAIEDDLFAAEPGTPSLSDNGHRSFDSAYDNGAPKRSLLKGPREQPPKPLAKADSGYSSNISLRSFKRDSAQTRVAAPSLPTREPNTRVPSSTYSVSSSTSDLTLRMKRSLPSLPPENTPPAVPIRVAPPAPLINTNKDVPNPPTPKKDQFLLSVPPKTRQKAIPPIPSKQLREDSPASSELSTNSSSSSRWSGKTKVSKRPASLQPQSSQNSIPKEKVDNSVFTVQAFRSPSEQLRIPPPSMEARRHLEERVEAFPVASFPNTMDGATGYGIGLRRSVSKETLGTIFSVGSAEVRDEINFARLQGKLPPVPVEPTIPEYPVKLNEGSRRNTFQGESVRVEEKPEEDLVKREARWGRRSYQHPPPPKSNRNSSKSRERKPQRERSLPRLPISNEDFEAHLTSFDTVSSSLGKSPYELAINTLPSQVQAQTPGRPQGRSRSMTQQIEAEAAMRFNLNLSSQRTEATVANQSAQLPRVRSYDSIPNPHQTAISARRSSREKPPPVHRNNSPWRPNPPAPIPQQHVQSQPQMQVPIRSPLSAHPIQVAELAANEPVVNEKRFSGIAKAKSPPPVSMSTQRKMVSRSHTSNTTSKSTQHAPPQQSQLQKAPEQRKPQTADQWANTASAWKEMRMSAGETLKSRKSMEQGLRQPQPQPQSVGPEIRGRKSMDASSRGTDQLMNTKIRNKKSWNVGVGYEDTNHNPNSNTAMGKRWTLGGGGNEQEYNHAFGSGSSGSDKENIYHTPQYHHRQQTASRPQSRHQSSNLEDEEYYDTSSDNHNQHTLSSQIHQRKTSTSEMLILDRFSGGLDYGFDPAIGSGRLVGSAGTTGGVGGVRKGLQGAQTWGVDLSDVPVILQRVRA